MKRLTILIISLLMLFVAAQAYAYGVTIVKDAGTTEETTALTGFETAGDMMVGMAFTAFFSGGGSETRYWIDLSDEEGGVFGDYWSMQVSGDTFYDSAWLLGANLPYGITSLYIDAGLGDTVFDTDYSPYPGTTGSASGKDFEVESGQLSDITATYYGAVALTGSDPVGDLYRYLKIDFASAFASGEMVFTQDTDNILLAGDINPVNPVPEPATMLLLGSGLIGLVGLGRRKLRKR